MRASAHACAGNRAIKKTRRKTRPLVALAPHMPPCSKTG